MLLLLEKPLKAAGFETLRLDGSMNAKSRASIIEQFQVSKVDKPLVLLASLRTSFAGINLTAASRVYLMEPWWDLAVEAVKVVRLIARNSIEEKILILQDKKNESLTKGFGRGSKDLVGVGIDDLHFVLGE